MTLDPVIVERSAGEALLRLDVAGRELRVLGKQLYAAADSDRDVDPSGADDLPEFERSEGPHFHRARELREVAVGVTAIAQQALAQQALSHALACLQDAARLHAIADVLDGAQPEARDV